MDAADIFQIINESTLDMDNSTCEELVKFLDFIEYVVIEDKKTELFKKRINYICMAISFKAAMERDYGCKQICRFLKRQWRYDDLKAKQTADKLNEARRVYSRLDDIVNNCCRCNVDVRDLTIKELYLANSLSWVIKRSVEIKPKKKIPGDAPIEVDAGSVQDSVNDILQSAWYTQARENPFLVAKILEGISTRVINDSVFSSNR